MILGGAGNKDDIQARTEQIEAIMEGTSSSYEKDKLKERLAKLSGGVAVIKALQNPPISGFELQNFDKLRAFPTSLGDVFHHYPT